MDWVKLLTEFENGPKTLAAGNAGAGLYARALAYCGKYETDGYVPKEWVEQAVAREGQQALVKHLLSVGFWEECDSGFFVPDFTVINRSREELSDLRRKRSFAGKKGGKSKRQASAKAKGKQNNSYSFSSSSSSSRKEGVKKRGSGGKEKGKPADPSVLPDNSDPRLAESARRCLPVLQRVAAARGANPVTLLAVYRAVESFAAKPHVQIAGEVEHWTVHGNGRNKPARDIVSRFRHFLADSADDVRPPKTPAADNPYARMEKAE